MRRDAKLMLSIVPVAILALWFAHDQAHPETFERSLVPTLATRAQTPVEPDRSVALVTPLQRAHGSGLRSANTTERPHAVAEFGRAAAGAEPPRTEIRLLIDPGWTARSVEVSLVDEGTLDPSTRWPRLPHVALTRAGFALATSTVISELWSATATEASWAKRLTTGARVEWRVRLDGRVETQRATVVNSSMLRVDIELSAPVALEVDVSCGRSDPYPYFLGPVHWNGTQLRQGEMIRNQTAQRYSGRVPSGAGELRVELCGLNLHCSQHTLAIGPDHSPIACLLTGQSRIVVRDVDLASSASSNRNVGLSTWAVRRAVDGRLLQFSGPFETLEAEGRNDQGTVLTLPSQGGVWLVRLEREVKADGVAGVEQLYFQASVYPHCATFASPYPDILSWQR